jgi:hypothetical protein
MQKRTLAGALIALLLAALVAMATPAAAASPTDEQGFVDKINQERTSRGLRPLIFDTQIRDVARAWSDQMASSGNFVHNPNYSKQIPAGWSRAGENIAWGSGTSATVAVLHQSLMNSPGHRDNILGDFTRVGVGVTVSGGKMWVTEDFAKYANDPVPSSGGTTTPPPTSVTTYTLTVTRSGSGKVTSSPTGISCGSDCTEAYRSGTTVTLTVTPTSSRARIAWSGACAGTTRTCTVSMTAARSVKVTIS